MKKEKVIEEGEEYLLVDSSSRGWIFNVELTDEVVINATFLCFETSKLWVLYCIFCR